MKYKDKITAIELVEQLTSHILLAQFGTKRIEWNLLDSEFIVFNGDVLVWQGACEETAVKHYNDEHTSLAT